MSLIILPKRRIIEPMPIDLAFQVRGMYRLKVRRPDDRLRVDTGWFPNLITNNGLNLMGSAAGYSSTCCVGTGNSAPAYTDTQLNALVASTGPIGSSNSQGGPPYYGQFTRNYQFGQGAAAGNLQEIGIGPSATSLFSRALILNNSGNPTTLTILSDEFLDVSYSYQFYAPTTDVTGSVTVGSTVCNYTLRAANCPNFLYCNDEQTGLYGVTIYSDTVLQPVTGTPTGTSQGQPSNGYSYASYTPGNYYVDSTANFGLNDCNGGANNLALCTFGRSNGLMGWMQCLFGATIPKNNTQLMTLTFRQSWGRGT